MIPKRRLNTQSEQTLLKQTKFLFQPLKMGRNFVFGCFNFFLLFFLQGRVIYHVKTLSVVIRKTFKNSKNFSIVEKKHFEIFDFWSNFALISQVVNCNSLFKLNLSSENLVLFN